MSTLLARLKTGFKQAFDTEPSLSFTAFVASKAIAIIYLIAFISLAFQVHGLFGETGILPINTVLENSSPYIYWFQLPHLFLTGSSFGISMLIGLGIAASFLLLLGFIPVAAASLAWLSYLSFVNFGQVFMSFQWDILLLELGFLCIFLCPLTLVWRKNQLLAPTKAVVWAFRFLLFRLMLGSGLVKLYSGDSTWRDLTAMSYHYWSQPLPHFISYFADKLPLFVHKLSAVLMFIIELVLPFFIFFSAYTRRIAGMAFIALMALILFTGNYNFFNLLVITACLFLFSESLFKRFYSESSPNQPNTITRYWQQAASYIAILLLFFGLCFDLARFQPSHTLQQWGIRLYKPISGFHVVNRYGLFATMTTDRKEIIVLGSLDNKHWKPYTFKYKAHSEFDRPKWASPHQARLDWQLWFLALRPYSERSWANALMQRLLEKDPHVEALFESVPFENGPKFIKLVSRKARFSSYSELSHSKKWWLFGPERAYSPSFVLNRF